MNILIDIKIPLKFFKNSKRIWNSSFFCYWLVLSSYIYISIWKFVEFAMCYIVYQFWCITFVIFVAYYVYDYITYHWLPEKINLLQFGQWNLHYNENHRSRIIFDFIVFIFLKKYPIFEKNVNVSKLYFLFQNYEIFLRQITMHLSISNINENNQIILIHSFVRPSIDHPQQSNNLLRNISPFLNCSFWSSTNLWTTTTILIK